MDSLHLFHELEALLRMDDRYCMADGTPIKNNIVSDALSLRPLLIKHLLSHEGIKKSFFIEVEGVQCFDSVKFQRFVMNKSFLADSYTSFKNKIGLTDEDGRFISESREVVLCWPYKDCLLEGGQTKEEAKRKEIFWNEILAPDEINRLTEPKVFVGFKRYDQNGMHEADRISPKDNIIIRGNNLMALYSLKARKDICGHVKLIYIDPPYNTGNDSFGYNDSFNHSTWLTFMNNRLSAAKKLLAHDGTLCISIDHNEIGYCITLVDAVFGKENLKNIITLKRGSVTGAKVINPGVVNLSEYVLIYSRDTNYWKPNRVFKAKDRDDRYNQIITNFSDSYEQWQFKPLMDSFCDDYQLTKKEIAKSPAAYNTLLEEYVINNAHRVVQFASLDDNNISISARELKLLSKEDQTRVYKMEREGKNPYFVYRGKLILFVKDRLIEVEGKQCFSEAISDIWDDILPNDLHNEGGVIFKKGKKPERLLQRLIELTTNPGDIVLDYHLGSGTTAAVALKNNRRFIGVEQMDYGENDCVKRIVNVIGDGSQYDERGVSKLTNWHGGGSFVYCELAKANEKYVDEIQTASTTASLKVIWDRMKESDCLNYKVKISEVDSNADCFDALSIDDQKRFLIECLDKNLLYVPLSDIDSDEYGVSEEDRRLTREFYANS